jgi:hypothetical protein
MRRPYVSIMYFYIIVNLIAEILIISLMWNYGEKRELRSFTFLDGLYGRTRRVQATLLRHMFRLCGVTAPIFYLDIYCA